MLSARAYVSRPFRVDQGEFSLSQLPQANFEAATVVFGLSLQQLGINEFCPLLGQKIPYLKVAILLEYSLSCFLGGLFDTISAARERFFEQYDGGIRMSLSCYV